MMFMVYVANLMPNANLSKCTRNGHKRVTNEDLWACAVPLRGQKSHVDFLHQVIVKQDVYAPVPPLIKRIVTDLANMLDQRFSPNKTILLSEFGALSHRNLFTQCRNQPERGDRLYCLCYVFFFL